MRFFLPLVVAAMVGLCSGVQAAEQTASVATPIVASAAADVAKSEMPAKRDATKPVIAQAEPVSAKSAQSVAKPMVRLVGRDTAMTALAKPSADARFHTRARAHRHAAYRIARPVAPVRVAYFPTLPPFFRMFIHGVAY